MLVAPVLAVPTEKVLLLLIQQGSDSLVCMQKHSLLQ